MGRPTATTADYKPPPAELTSKLYWLASFQSQDAYDTDHKERESNKVFIQKFFSTGANKENPMMSMAGSYMGPVLHLEKPGGGACTATYTIVVKAVAKDADAAKALVEANRAHALQQLAAEEGALRYTIFRDVDGVMPGPKDERAVTWIEVWRTAADHAAHKQTAHCKAMGQKMHELTADPARDCTVLEFAETKHFSK